jgi:hypothetical protein
MTNQSMQNAILEQPTLSPSAIDLAKSDHSVERLKRLYKADVQAEFLYLQAETDSLLRELEAIQKGYYTPSVHSGHKVLTLGHAEAKVS